MPIEADTLRAINPSTEPAIPDRAVNIRTILMKEGVPARNLIVKSFGDTKNKENKVIIEFEKK